MIMQLIGTRREEVDCTVEVSNTFDSLHAHVRFDGGVTVEPGDAVLVHGAPVAVPYGETACLRRRATIRRAGWLERLWTRATGDLEFMELCEFSFSERATL
ncbi:hypothetical protein LQ948_11815 [Jiella sp. MQZ9-1]|uniref:Uncharacterized protein n=1 Tax=Jiella flava TaxID=2816857 RepID=A0A939JXF7_9HYPH|nr:hypothetical protein [Jiella flava]MBO0663321.1 hypothetical protein [Jiella flava]MCD2471897.1 hypothetical protein [Jiella flava]